MAVFSEGEAGISREAAFWADADGEDDENRFHAQAAGEAGGESWLDGGEFGVLRLFPYMLGTSPVPAAGEGEDCGAGGEHEDGGDDRVEEAGGG